MATTMVIIEMGTNRLVDLHCHILPGLDDGSPSLDASIKMAKAAVADGVGYILATPHHLDRHYVNHVSFVRAQVQAFQAELALRKIELQVFPGQEIHLSGHLLDELDDLLGIDTARNYLLLELPHEMVPDYLNQIVFQLLCAGITPVIAHPERNAQIMMSPEILYELIKQGTLAQVTATSLVGGFGRQVQHVALKLIACGLVQVVGSDAHAIKGRSFAMTDAYEVLAKLGTNYPEQFEKNARDLLNGDKVSAGEIAIPKKRRFELF